MLQENNKTKDIVLATAFFPPISYLKSIIASENVLIELYENYQKQSYRNRCKIYAANGQLSIVIPVEQATIKKINIKDVRIDYKTSWQKQHLKSIESAYRTSPFYEFLIDDFSVFFTKKFIFLHDLNTEILRAILEILEVKKNITYTSAYEYNYIEKLDYRTIYHPKHLTDYENLMKPYPQVFDHKYGFIPNLSCIDLLFNLGSNAFSYLIEKY